MKVVINSSGIGLFALSDDHVNWLRENRGWRIIKDLEDVAEKTIYHDTDFNDGRWLFFYVTLDKGSNRKAVRHHKDIVDCVCEVGQWEWAKVVDIPDDIDWYISEDDCGTEVVHEKHRTWR